MNTMINDFVAKLNSKHTKASYRSDLHQVTSFLQKSLFEASAGDLTNFRDAMMVKGTLPTTINRKFSTFKSFYEWGLKQGYCTTNPVGLIDLPRPDVKNPTQALSDIEVKNLTSLPDASDLNGLRHRMCFVLLTNLALRRSELTTLRFNDIQDEAGMKVFRVHGKGGKFRRLPLRSELYQELVRYQDRFETFTGEKLQGSDFVIQTTKSGKNSKPANPNSILRIVKKYCKLAGIDQRIGAHSLRTTTISHLLDTRKIPIRDVAIFAGHSSTNTTQIYDKKRLGILDSAALSVGFDNV